MRRKRGGQVGNRNALKHGFYAESFKQREGELLSSGQTGDFDGEIDLLRILIKRTLDKAKAQNDLTLEDDLTILRTVSFATAVMQRLARSKDTGWSEVPQENMDGG